MPNPSTSDTDEPRTGGEAAAETREPETASRSFGQVLDAELEAIRLLRERRGRGGGRFRGRTPVERAHDANLVGLAFSGGGIRSATFNLGIIQGLARLGLLPRFDYLSVNSGGGYIGSWLGAWIRRRGLAAVTRGRRRLPAGRGKAARGRRVLFRPRGGRWRRGRTWRRGRSGSCAGSATT